MPSNEPWLNVRTMIRSKRKRKDDKTESDGRGYKTRRREGLHLR